MREILVSQLTSRRQYDVAKCYWQSGVLARLVTDIYFRPDSMEGRALSAILPRSGRSWLSRQTADGVPSNRVVSNWAVGVRFKLRMRSRFPIDRALAQVAAYRQLNIMSIKAARACADDTAIFGLDTAALELFRWAADVGRPSILEQCVAPRSTQLRVAEELAKAEGRAGLSDSQREAFRLLADREREEWGLASTILCPSEFVFSELVANGVPVSKLRVLPYAASGCHAPPTLRERGNSPLRVLFVGNDAPRKGLSVVLACAERLNSGLEFVIVGALDPANEDRVRRLGLGNVSYLGKLDHERLAKVYATSDVFLFPSRLEGSALVTYEALSWGLPVVTTLESGSVVRDKEDGYIVPVGGVDEAVHALELLRDESVRMRMGLNARSRIDTFSLARYCSGLVETLAALSPETRG